MVEQRLPAIDGDEGHWGEILNRFISKEHYNDGTNNPVNGGHQKITIQPGTAAAGTAPLKFASGTLLTTPEAGAMEFAGDNYYLTQTTGTTRKKIAAYDDTSGATGDIYYRNSSGYFTRLGVGGTGNILTVSGGIPSWSSSISNTSTITLKDTNFTLQDDGDSTKQLKFQLSGITTGTTRTLTVPDVSDTIVTLGATQTLTGKTISGSSNTISNLSAATITSGTFATARIPNVTKAMSTDLTTLFGFVSSAGSSGANLVPNPSFEVSGFASGGGTITTDQAHSGTKSLAMVGTGGYYHAYLTVSDAAYNPIKCQSGDVFYAEVWVYGKSTNTQTSGGTNGLNMFGSFIDDSGSYIGSSYVYGPAASTALNGVWTKFSGYITAPANAAAFNFLIGCDLQVTTGETYYFDDVVLKEVPRHLAPTILDSNNNAILGFSPVASAVNYLTITNSTTGLTPSIASAGTDASINLDLTPKGTGQVRILGVPVVTETKTQTLTNKTLTSPTINTATSLSVSGVSTLLAVARLVCNSLLTAATLGVSLCGVSATPTGAYTWVLRVQTRPLQAILLLQPVLTVEPRMLFGLG